MSGSICFTKPLQRMKEAWLPMPPSSAPASRGRSGVPPTAAEWEQLRLLFTRLYVEENTTLKEIRQTLARDHGFHATERMYKSRITQWGIGKNNKERDLLHLIRKARKRIAQGKASSLRVRGRKKTLREALQHFKRKHGLDEMQIKERLPSSPTPSVVSCDTLLDRAEYREEDYHVSGVHGHSVIPSASLEEQDNGPEPSQRMVKFGEGPARSPCSTFSMPPGTSMVTLHHVYDWQGGLRLNPSPSTPQQMLQMQRVAFRTKVSCSSFLDKGKLGEDSSVSVNNTYAFPCLMYNAGAHSVVGRLDIAMPYYDAAAALVMSLLKSQTPLCLVLVYQLTCSRQRLGREPNTSAMLRFISELTSDRFAKFHPIVQLIESILDNPLPRDELSELSVRQALMAFENSFGFVHGYTQETAYRLCQTLMNRGAHSEATLLLRKMVAAHEVLSGKCSYDVCWTLMALGDCHLAQGNLIQAAQVYNDSAERARSPSIYQRDHIRVRYYQCTAELWRVRGDFEKAEVMAKLGIDLASQAFGPEDYRVIGIRGILSKIEQQKYSSH